MMFDLRTPRGAGTSAFSQLDAPPERIFVQEGRRAKLLPTCCGTYAFHDGTGKLLYIGKAKNVRTRVLSHLRDSAPQPLLLRPWTHLVARIELRPAQCEMEALLVEADLVGRLRPPFNRQMRSWSRYCYLVPTSDHANPLSISCQLQSWRRCFGPYRTRRQAVRIVEAVFRLVTRNGDADMLAKCYRLLGGEDDSLVVDLERQQETLIANKKDKSWARSLPQLTDVLRKASERAALLRNAEETLNGMIFMPGRDDGRTAAVITDAGLHLERIEPTIRSAEAFLAGYRKLVGDKSNGSPRCLPKAISDCLCVAAHQIRRHRTEYRFMPVKEASDSSAADLLAFAFGDVKSEA